MCTQSQLKKILDGVSQKTQALLGERLRNIILYGSYARGDYDNESDVDIAILVDIPRDEERIYTDDIVALMSAVDKLLFTPQPN